MQADGGSLRGRANKGRARSHLGKKVLFPELEEVVVEVLEDGRLYVPVDIYGVTCFGLLDSGATVSTVGGQAWQKIKSLNNNKHSIICGESWERLQRSNVKLMECSTKRVKVANGHTCPVLGKLDAPVVLDGVMKVCTFLVVPDIKQEVILGLDFWRRFGLLPDVVRGTCVLAQSDLPELSEVIIPKDKLSGEERALLDDVVARYRATLGRAGLGCTKLVEHRIDTGDAKPIRQRYYSYSPKLLDVLHTGVAVALYSPPPRYSSPRAYVLHPPRPQGVHIH